VVLLDRWRGEDDLNASHSGYRRMVVVFKEPHSTQQIAHLTHLNRISTDDRSPMPANSYSTLSHLEQGIQEVSETEGILVH
jgi:hypothetical protein